MAERRFLVRSLLSGVVAHRPEEPEPRFVVFVHGLGPEQGSLAQATQQGQHRVARGDHCFGVLYPERAGKHSQLPETGPLVFLEQLPGRGDRRPERLVSRGAVPAVGPEQVQLASEALEQGVGAQQVGPGGGHLDGEGDPVELLDHRGHRGVVGVALGSRAQPLTEALQSKLGDADLIAPP